MLQRNNMCDIHEAHCVLLSTPYPFPCIHRDKVLRKLYVRIPCTLVITSVELELPNRKQIQSISSHVYYWGSAHKNSLPFCGLHKWSTNLPSVSSFYLMYIHHLIPLPCSWSKLFCAVSEQPIRHESKRWKTIIALVICRSKYNRNDGLHTEYFQEK